jgi:exodeoxyribonuclease V alpha subunit
MVDHADNTGEEERFALLLASALISKYTGDGHICLNLSELAGRPLPSDETDDAPDISCPELSRWARLLKATGVVKEPGEFAPLIIDREMRLYLYRYWRYEKELAQAVARRLQSAMNDIGEDQSRSCLNACSLTKAKQSITRR